LYRPTGTETIAWCADPSCGRGSSRLSPPSSRRSRSCSASWDIAIAAGLAGVMLAIASVVFFLIAGAPD
jgi:hypothetical protein